MVQLLAGDGHASGRPTGSSARTTASAGRPVPISAFARAVLQVVAGTRAGELLTYGEVAREAGHPGAARAVGRVMREHGSDSPWWRVVAANGRLVPGLEEEHARRLAAEGVISEGGRVRT